MSLATFKEVECEFEQENGRYRMVCPDSRLIREGARVTRGPWCVSALAAQEWWDKSETAREMKYGPRKVEA